MRLYIVLMLVITFWSTLILAEQQTGQQIKPANVLMVCALHTNRAAFATDTYGNLIYCANDTCQEIMSRPDAAIPVSLSCVNESFAYIYYSNKKLYRCHSIGRCTVMEIEDRLKKAAKVKK